MNSNICTNCGGDYEYRSGRWVCRACGAYKPEELSNEEVTLLYTASQKLRLADFDEAEREYDDIIRKYPKNPNGYWGRLMSRYGIKYEEDFDGRRIPTCYATSIESITADPDYREALEYADAETKAYYTAQADYMERVRKEWVEKAIREKPYDIFICYKDSDLANGISRTEDSVAVQELYIHLTGKGYRVFYSRESLRGKVGEKYEPYIFSALSTAEVMLVYGSKPEYITSTWLKNEWLRYVKKIQAGEKQANSLLVACDGFSPALLPKTLASRQCFDANQRTFFSDLDDVIARILGKDSASAVAVGMAGERAMGSQAATPQEKKKKTTKKRGKALPVIILCVAMAIVGTFAAMGLNLFGGLNVSKPDFAPEETEMLTTVLETPEVDSDESNTPVTDISGAETTSPMDPECDHVIVTDEAIAPTCTESGLTEGAHCSSCGGILVAQEPVAARGHTEAINAAVEPTCAKAGLTEGTYCTTCDTVMVEQTYVAPRGHSYVSGVCSVCGMSEVAADEMLFVFTKLSDGTYSVKARNPAGISGHIVVPEMYNGKLVTEIGANAFAESAGLTSIDIPDSVTSIGGNAFYYCRNLTSVTIPAGVVSIQRYTFYGCSSLTTVDLPSGIASIADHAFTFCRSITQLTLPSNLMSIGEQAFYNCSGLEELVIPGKVRNIGNRAFGCCYGLKAIAVAQGNSTYHSAGNCLIETASKTLVLGCASSTIPTNNSVTSIGDYAFEVCNDLKSITIPEGVTTLGRSVFLSCSRLESVNLPSTLIGIGISAFETCRSLRKIDYNGTQAEWDRVSKGQDWNADTGAFTVHYSGDTATTEPETGDFSAGLTYTSNSDGTYSVTGLGSCKDAEVVVPTTYNGKQVTSIGTGAFGRCDTVTSVVLPNTIKSIEYQAFYQCKNLMEIVIPGSVKTIGNEAFDWCENLLSVTFSSGITSIGNYAFANCKNLKSVVLPSTVTSIGEYAFLNCTNIASVTMSNGVKTIGNSAFNECKKITSITIPKSVTKIGERAFQNCASLSSITVESGNTVYHSAGNCLIETASKTLIQGCLKSVIPKDGSITKIGNYAFLGYYNLTSIVIPEGVTEIGELSFYYCRDLASVVIPSSMRTIGLRAFDYCTSLSSISYAGTQEQWNAITKGNDWDRDTDYTLRYNYGS